MRKLALLLIAPFVAATAGAQARSRPAHDSHEVTHQVTVKLLRPSPATREPLRYVLSEPAYIAVFVVVPGSGVRLLYPEVDQSRLQYAGYHSEPLFGAHFDDDIYNVVLGPGTGGPSYLYIVASRYPLDVGRFVHRPSRLATTVGYKSARSFNPDVAMDALLNRVVSLGGSDSWDADVYMLWVDQPRFYANGSVWGFQDIYCASGFVMRVPAFYPFRGCPGDSRVLIQQQEQIREWQQQQALAAPRAPAATPLQQDASRIMPPTVLPTIRGVRRTSAGEAEAASSSVPYPTTVTAAGPVVATMTNAAEPSAWSATPTVIAPVIVETPILVRDRGDEGSRSRRQDEDYNGRRNGWAERESQGSIVGRSSPVLAPTPRLAPSPGTAPEPRFAPAPSIPHAAPPMEMPRREIERPPAPAPVVQQVPERATQIPQKVQ